MSGTPCRVTADLSAHMLREDRAPDEICDRCGASLFGDKRNPKWEPADENWLVCRCGNALCEDCCVAIREAEEESGFRQWLGWETTHNEGFCSPACMARDLNEARRKLGLIRERIAHHANQSDSQRQACENAFLAPTSSGRINYIGLCSALLTELRSLIDLVREVSK